MTHSGEIITGIKYRQAATFENDDLLKLACARRSYLIAYFLVNFHKTNDLQEQHIMLINSYLMDHLQYSQLGIAYLLYTRSSHADQIP